MELKKNSTNGEGTFKEIEKSKQLQYYVDHFYSNFPFFLQSLSSHNAITYTFFGDMQRNVFYISDNLKEDFGFDANLVQDFLVKWEKHIFGEKWKTLYADDQKRIIETKDSNHDLIYQVQDISGKVFWIRCCGDMQWNEDKTKPLFFAGRIAKQSDVFVVDPVSNFPTTSTLKRILKSKEENHEKFWTIGFYLNEMSKINTLHGHTFGDRLIKDISRDLMEGLGEELTFYRLPGVRFVAIADTDKEIDKEKVIDNMRRIIKMEYDGFGLVVENPCTFVPVFFPQQDWTVEQFLENMVGLIKKGQHDEVKEDIKDVDKCISQIRAFSTLSNTISQNIYNYMEHFRIMVQPIVDAKSGKIIGGETLMRWKFNDKDVPPSDFIPILEKDRMIQFAGRWVLEQAVQVCSDILKDNPNFYLTVNVSLLQLYDNELIPFIPSVLKKYNVSGKNIVLEMTESTMDNVPGKLLELIKTCKKLKIRIALDDFGTGYSSLRVLMKYPIDIIKIDRSLLLEMVESEAKNNFFTSLIHAGHHFGKKICVEGVETEHQRDIVLKSNVDIIQGFFFYRPLEIPDLFKAIKGGAN